MMIYFKFFIKITDLDLAEQKFYKICKNKDICKYSIDLKSSTSKINRNVIYLSGLFSIKIKILCMKLLYIESVRILFNCKKQRQEKKLR